VLFWCDIRQGAGSAARVEAFKDCINSIIENAEKNGLPGLREVNEVYPWIAQMLFIDPNVAKNYVEPLGQAKFDKAVGNMVNNLIYLFYISRLQCRISCSEYRSCALM
jgi:hypothetical protein